MGARPGRRLSAANDGAFSRVDADGSGTVDVNESVSIFEQSIVICGDDKFAELMLKYEGAAFLCAENAEAAKAATAKVEAAKAAAEAKATEATEAAEAAKAEELAASVINAPPVRRRRMVATNQENNPQPVVRESRFSEYKQGLTPLWVNAVRHIRGPDMAHLVEHPEHFVEPTQTLILGSSSNSC